MTHDQANAVFQRAAWQQRFYEVKRIRDTMRGKPPAYIVNVSDDQIQRQAWRDGCAIARAIIKHQTSGLPLCAVGLGDNDLAKMTKLYALLELEDTAGGAVPLRGLLDATDAGLTALLANVHWRAIKRRADGRALAAKGTLQ